MRWLPIFIKNLFLWLVGSMLIVGIIELYNQFPNRKIGEMQTLIAWSIYIICKCYLELTK